MREGCVFAPWGTFESDVEPAGWKRVLAYAHGHRFINHTDECWYWQTNDGLAEVALDVAAVKSGSGLWDAPYYLKDFLDKKCPEKKVALVPMPPSSVTWKMLAPFSMKEICECAAGMCNVTDACMREVLYKVAAAAPAHLTKEPRSVEKTYSNMAVMFGDDMSRYDEVFIVDDVLSSGAHFKAAKNCLRGAYGIEAKGLFLARTPAKNNKPIMDYWTWKNDLPCEAQEVLPAKQHERAGLFARVAQSLARIWAAKQQKPRT